MFFVRYIKVMIGYLTSYLKESSFCVFLALCQLKLYFGLVGGLYA